MGTLTFALVFAAALTWAKWIPYQIAMPATCNRTFRVLPHVAASSAADESVA